MEIKKVMKQTDNRFEINDSLDEILKHMKKNNCDQVFITNRNIFVGILEKNYILKKTCENKSVEMSNLVNTNIKTFNKDDFIVDVSISKYEINPVVDKNRKLIGSVSKKDIIFRLNNKNETLKAIFDNSFDGLYITDGKGYTLSVNKAYLKITGLKKENLIGFHMKELIKKGYFKDSVSLKIIETKKAESLIDSFENGKKCFITGTPVINRKGQVIRVVTNVRDMTELKLMQKRVEESERRNERYKNEVNNLKNLKAISTNIKGNSIEIQNIIDRIRKVSEVNATVLITGETGVGKELVAREIHKKSDRKDKPFIKINCAAIPENLMEAELFGYCKGAFTGAKEEGKIGYFEMANKGSILLDEIGEIPIQLQAKLLRVLQEKEIQRIGESKKNKIDVRILASTNRDLTKLIEKKMFREDLYYRLNVLPIHVPPLRERMDDIELLANNFLHEYNAKYNKNKILSDESYNEIKKYKWPGNVRQLKNTIKQMVILVDDNIIKRYHIKELVNSSSENKNNVYNTDRYKLKEAKEIIEKHYIKETLKRHKNTREAAKHLGISQPSVVRKKKKYNI